MISSSHLHRALLAAILIFAGAFRLAVINVPFGRNAEGCASFYGLVARNYFRYPFSAHHGVPVMSMGQGAPVVYYANHPPTTPLLVAGVFAMTGYRGAFDLLPGDWQVRLPTAIFTVACTGLLYLLVRNRAGPRTGLLAASIFASIPMTLIYGGFPDVISPQLLFFALLTIAAYERFHDAPNLHTFGALSLSFLGAAIVDWPAFHIVPVICLHFVLTRKPKLWGWIIAFGLVTVAVFGLLYIYLATAQHNWLWMKSLVQRRSISTGTDVDHEFTLMGWVNHAWLGLAVGRHTLIVCIFAGLGIATALIRRGNSGIDRLMGLLFAWAIVHIFIGAQGVYRHEWWWWPLTPALVIAAAVGIDDLLTHWQRDFAISSKKLNMAAIASVVLFASWNTHDAWHEHVDPTLIPKAGGPVAYSLQELGQVIRDHSSPTSAVAVTETDDSLGFWYYADRALKTSIWDAETLDRRISDTSVELSFNVEQTFKPPAKVLVIPRYYAARFVAPLVAVLNSRFSHTETDKFLIYDLSVAAIKQ